MDAVDPDGFPAVFEEGAWLSHDRRFRWTGAEWIPTKSPSKAGLWMVKLGSGVVLLGLLGYTVYTTIATQSEYTIGYYVGVALFFAVLLAIFRVAGRWGCFGIVVRAGCGLLAALKILTVIAHPLPT